MKALLTLLLLSLSASAYAETCGECMIDCNIRKQRDPSIDCIGECIDSCETERAPILFAPAKAGLFTPAPKEERHCRAILLGDGVEDSTCQAKNESLSQLSAAEWNRLVCGEPKEFTLGEDRFRREEESFNLSSNSGSIYCEWEIRANNGRN